MESKHSMTKPDALGKLQADHKRLLQTLNVVSAMIEWNPVLVDRHDGRGPQRTGGALTGLLYINPSQKLRDIANSLIFRFEALYYHLNLILDLESERESLITSNNLPEETKIKLWNLHFHAHFLFDDIVFNVCSMLDYLGALLLGSLLKHVKLIPGTDGIDEKHFDWGCLAKYACEKDARTQFQSTIQSLAQMIIDEDKRYVKKLFNYRNKAIHLAVKPNMPDLLNHKILIPNTFASDVGFESLSGKHNVTPMHEGCVDLIHRTTSSLVAILEHTNKLLFEGTL